MSKTLDDHGSISTLSKDEQQSHTRKSNSKSQKHRIYFRYYMFPTIIILAIIIFIIFIILWKLNYIFSPNTKSELQSLSTTTTTTSTSLSTTWEKNTNFLIKSSNGKSYSGISNEGIRFIQCSNNDKNEKEYSFIEINDIYNDNNKDSFYLFWDIPTSISYCDMSSDGSIALWTYYNDDKNDSNNNIKITYCNINNPIECINQDIIDNNHDSDDKFDITSISTSKNGKRLAIGIANNKLEYSFVRIYYFNGKSLKQLGNDISGSSTNAIINSLSISENGDIVAIGWYSSSSNSLIDDNITNIISSSQVSMHKYSPFLKRWNKKGTISLKYVNDDDNDNNDNMIFGITTSLSYNGNIIAIGSSSSSSSLSSVSNTTKSTMGKCQIFQFSNNNIWKEITIIKNDYLQQISIVKLSGNGERLFISSLNHIKSYHLLEQNNWILAGWLSYDNSTTITSISSTYDGRRIVINSSGNDDKAEVYDEIDL